jgi:hypothetical protein
MMIFGSSNNCFQIARIDLIWNSSRKTWLGQLGPSNMIT